MSDKNSRLNAVLEITYAMPYATSMTDTLKEIWACDVFGRQQMEESLSKSAFKAIKKTVQTGAELDSATADVVAAAMKDWAMSKGAKFFSHIFYPMTNATAEKHDGFIVTNSDGNAITEFTGSLLIKGELKEDWFDKVSEDGEYVRKDSQFRNMIKPVDAEKGRYHLYVSYACPWAHRTLIFRKLKKLEDIISVSVVHPFMDNQGWDFKDDYPSATGDTLYNFMRMHEIYTKAQPDYSGIVTVPVLWDKKEETIVNNESSEIIRILNSAFNHLIDDEATRALDFYPEEKRSDIDVINSKVYESINNGVYQTGFATTQKSYEKAYNRLFNALDEMENILSKQRYLTGDQITEADWRLFVTLIRFDAVYVGHFKCNKKRIYDYPNLYNFMLELYQWQGVADTTNFDHIKYHYYYSHDMINPTQIVPLGPEQNLNQKHNREKF